MPKTKKKKKKSTKPTKKSSTKKAVTKTKPKSVTASPKKTEDDKWRKVENVKKYWRYKECKPGQTLVEGVYIGDSPNQYGRDNHDFREADGTVVSLNAAGQLDYLVQQNLVVGDECKIVYAGKTKLEKGKFKNSEAHNFELFLGEMVDRKTKPTEDLDEVEDEDEELEDMEVEEDDEDEIEDDDLDELAS